MEWSGLSGPWRTWQQGRLGGCWEENGRELKPPGLTVEEGHGLQRQVVGVRTEGNLEAGRPAKT